MTLAPALSKQTRAVFILRHIERNKLTIFARTLKVTDYPEKQSYKTIFQHIFTALGAQC